MDEVFRLDLDCSCPSLPAFPLECHMILYDTVGCIVNPLPLEDLPIVRHSDKNTKVIMHGDEGIDVDGLKQLNPGPSTHDGIHLDGMMEHGPSHIHYELVPLLSVIKKDGLMELDPGSIHNGDIMEQAWSQSVLNQLWILMTLLTVPMRMKSFCFYFQSYLHLFLTLNQSWTLVWVRCLDSIRIAPALHYQPSHWNAI
jgi:hypothetical protein